MNPEMNTAAVTHDAPANLRINLREHALSVPKEALSFSWNMQSTRPDEIQTGYRIVLASRLSDMESGSYILDTGWVATDKCANVSVTGAEALLGDNELYYWAVQTRDRDGGESPLSAPTAFSTAIGNEWAGTDLCWADSRDADTALPDFAFFRGQFTLEKDNAPERALLSVTAVSPEPARQYVYWLSVNDSSVGMGPARLGLDGEGASLLYYHTYDVTALLHEGENALGAVCYTAAEHGFLCQLTFFYPEDGGKEIVFSSARDREKLAALDGTAAFAPDGRSVGTDYYFAPAENLSAADYPTHFTASDFQPSGWRPAVLSPVTAKHEGRCLVSYPGDPVVRQYRAPLSITATGSGSYLVDLGYEIIGTLQLTADTEEPRTLTLSYGEELDGTGHVLYRMRTGNEYREYWTLRPGEQTLEGFGMKAFRYAEIENWEGALREDMVSAVSYSAEFDPDASGFVCSNETLCTLYDTFKYAISVTNQDLYVDSQSRERRAYEGDALVNMLSAYTYEARFALPRFSVEYLLYNRTWPAEYALLSVHNVWLDYLYTGNSALAVRSYPRLKQLIAGLTPDEKTELIPNPPVKDGQTDTVMVDWPASCRDGYEMESTRYNTVYNSFAYLALTDFACLANALRREEDSAGASDAAVSLRRAMLRQLYIPETGEYCDGLTADGTPVSHSAQHATAAALYAGAYEGRRMADAMGRALIRQVDIRTSIYFAYFVVEALYRAGFGAYATALLANNDTANGSHSWATALAADKVTIAPEAWCAAEKPNRTLSHPWGTAPAALLVRGMFGILPARPGFRSFTVAPQLGDIPYASVTLPTARGSVAVTVAQNSEAYEMEITVPANTGATVSLPAVPGGQNQLFVDGQHANLPCENGIFSVHIGSGTHRLLAQ